MPQRPGQTPALGIARLRPVRLLSIVAGVALASTAALGRPVGGALDVDFGESAISQAASIAAHVPRTARFELIAFASIMVPIRNLPTPAVDDEELC